MGAPGKKYMLKFDPRTELLFLVLANVVAFTQHSLWVEITWVVLLLLLIIACGCTKAAGRLAFAFGLIVGTLIIQKTSVKELMVALRECHIPQGLIIPLSVTIRYFPALKEEAGYIRDAMKLRDIHGIQKIEYLLVPVMISATTTAEELSAAAVTRGVENPAHKTSMVEMKFGVQDFLCLAFGVVFCFISVTAG